MQRRALEPDGYLGDSGQDSFERDVSVLYIGAR